MALTYLESESGVRGESLRTLSRPLWTACVRACVHVYTWVRIRIFMHHMTECESHEFSICHIPTQGNTFFATCERKELTWRFLPKHVIDFFTVIEHTVFVLD